MQGNPASLAIAVHADAACDGVDPRQHRLAGPVVMTHAMDAHPGFLQKIVSLFSAIPLAPKEPQQRRADGADQSPRRVRVGLLIAFHPAIQVEAPLGEAPLGDTGARGDRVHPCYIRSPRRRSYAFHNFYFQGASQIAYQPWRARRLLPDGTADAHSGSILS